MCGRLNINADPLTRLLMELVGLTHPGPDNYNAAPTETIAVLRLSVSGEPEIVPMRWWLVPHWAKEPSTRYSMFNARSESAAKSPAFREPLKKRRCVVPVSGFYEWQRGRDRKLPFYLHPRDADGLLLAGLWDRWQDPERHEALESFAILTVPAAEEMSFVHTRQPLMLSMADAHRWMDPGNDHYAELIRSALPVPLEAVPVSTYVNNARHKDPRCIEPVGEPIVLAPGARNATDAER